MVFDDEESPQQQHKVTQLSASTHMEQLLFCGIIVVIIIIILLFHMNSNNEGDKIYDHKGEVEEEAEDRDMENNIKKELTKEAKRKAFTPKKRAVTHPRSDPAGQRHGNNIKMELTEENKKKVNAYECMKDVKLDSPELELFHFTFTPTNEFELEGPAIYLRTKKESTPSYGPNLITYKSQPLNLVTLDRVKLYAEAGLNICNAEIRQDPLLHHLNGYQELRWKKVDGISYTCNTVLLFQRAYQKIREVTETDWKFTVKVCVLCVCVLLLGTLLIIKHHNNTIFGAL